MLTRSRIDTRVKQKQGRLGHSVSRQLRFYNHPSYLLRTCCLQLNPQGDGSQLYGMADSLETNAACLLAAVCLTVPSSDSAVSCSWPGLPTAIQPQIRCASGDRAKKSRCRFGLMTACILPECWPPKTKRQGRHWCGAVQRSFVSQTMPELLLVGFRGEATRRYCS